jgi:hypothetical protein
LVVHLLFDGAACGNIDEGTEAQHDYIKKQEYSEKYLSIKYSPSYHGLSSLQYIIIS